MWLLGRLIIYFVRHVEPLCSNLVKCITNGLTFLPMRTSGRTSSVGRCTRVLDSPAYSCRKFENQNWVRRRNVPSVKRNELFIFICSTTIKNLVLSNFVSPSLWSLPTECQSSKHAGSGLSTQKLAMGSQIHV